MPNGQSRIRPSRIPEIIAGFGKLGPGSAIEAGVEGVTKGVDLATRIAETRRAAEETQFKQQQLKEKIRQATEEAARKKRELEAGLVRPGELPEIEREVEPGVAKLISPTAAGMGVKPKTVFAVNENEGTYEAVSLRPGEALPPGFVPEKAFGRTTEAQSKVATYARIMIRADENMDQLKEQRGLDPAALKNSIALLVQIRDTEDTPGAMTNWLRSLQSPELQSFYNQARAFAQADTRAVSGAAIKPSEIIDTIETFIELPGEAAEVSKLKTDNRKTRIAGFVKQSNQGLFPGQEQLNESQIRQETLQRFKAIFPAEPTSRVKPSAGGLPRVKSVTRVGP